MGKTGTLDWSHTVEGQTADQSLAVCDLQQMDRGQGRAHSPGTLRHQNSTSYTKRHTYMHKLFQPSPQNDGHYQTCFPL